MAGNVPDYPGGLPPMPTDKFLSTSEYDLGWISGLYEAANLSLTDIFSSNEFKLNPDDILDFNYFDDDTYLTDNAGPIVYMSVWAGLTLIFVILGIIWCFCNKCICCCKSSYKVEDEQILLESADPQVELRPYYSERNDSKFKGHRVAALVLSVLMGVWLLGYLGVIVNLYATNEIQKDAFDDIQRDLDNSHADIHLYLNSTRGQLKYVFVESFSTLSNKVREVLGECEGCELTSQVFPKIHNDIDSLMSTLNAMGGDSLSEMDTVKSSLVSLKTILSNAYQTNDIIRENVEKALAATATELNKSFKEFDDSLEQVQQEIRDIKAELEGDYEDTLDDAINGVYWGIMMLNFLYSAIFIVALVGTLLATFGARRGMKFGGYLCYRFAIVVMFILSIFVVGQMLFAFSAAGIASGIVCPAVRELESPDSSIEASIKQGQGGDGYVVPTYGEIVRACKGNQSAYNAFALKAAYDVDQIETIIKENFDNLMFEGMDSLRSQIMEHLSQAEYSLNNTVIIKNGNVTPLLTNLQTDVTSFLNDFNTPQGTPEETVLEIQHQVNSYAKFIVDVVKQDAGKCEPAYNAINATISLFCYKIVAPVASFWFMLQFVPVAFLLITVTALLFERFHY